MFRFEAAPVPLTSPPTARRWAAVVKLSSTVHVTPRTAEVTLNRGPVAVRWRAVVPAGERHIDPARVELVGMWVVRPARTAWGARIRRTQTRGLVAPERSFGRCGAHSVGSVAVAGVGGLLGAATGGYGIGGPLALVWGAMLGAVLGYLVRTMFAVAGRRHLRGPISGDNTDLMGTIAALHDVVVRAQDGRGEKSTTIQAAAAARTLLWTISDPAASDQRYRRLRYSAHMLRTAFSDHQEAQDALDTATAVPGVEDRTRGSVDVEHLLDFTGSVTERLLASSRAVRDVAGQVNAARQAGTA